MANAGKLLAEKRWKKTTQKERSDIAKKMVEAREEKRKKKLSTPPA